MKDVNKVILLGRLGADPIQRQTKTGTTVVTLSIATSRKYSRENANHVQEEVEETQWHKAIAWGKQGEVCAQYLKKGNAVYIEGQIRSKTYEDKNNQSRISFEIHVDQISFLGIRQGGQKPQTYEPPKEVAVDLPVAADIPF